MGMSEEFGDPVLLQKKRMSLGVTQAELAARAGVKRTLISDIENGRQSFAKHLRKPIWEALFSLKERHTTIEDALIRRLAQTIAELNASRELIEAQREKIDALEQQRSAPKTALTMLEALSRKLRAAEQRALAAEEDAARVRNFYEVSTDAIVKTEESERLLGEIEGRS